MMILRRSDMYFLPSPFSALPPKSENRGEIACLFGMHTTPTKAGIFPGASGIARLSGRVKQRHGKIRPVIQENLLFLGGFVQLATLSRVQTTDVNTLCLCTAKILSARSLVNVEKCTNAAFGGDLISGDRAERGIVIKIGPKAGQVSACTGINPVFFSLTF